MSKRRWPAPDLFGERTSPGGGATRSDIVDIAGDLRHETPGDNGAFLIFDGTKEVWVPKSLVEHDPQNGTFAMPEWLAKDKGLI
jgi:hypothetical protein